MPQYDPQVIYVDDGGADVLTTALVTFGMFVLIDEIFDDDDHWHGYWGCRNCGGWGGGPIIINPDIDIDIDGDVHIGDDIGWKPEPKRQQEARDKIADKRGPDGATRLPLDKPASRGDALRGQLADKSGAADIARDRSKMPDVNRPSARPDTAKKDAIARTGKKPAAAKPSVKKPAAKPETRQPAARAPAKRAPSAMSKRAPAPKSRAGSNRGKASGAKHRGRR